MRLALGKEESVIALLDNSGESTASPGTETKEETVVREKCGECSAKDAAVRCNGCSEVFCGECFSRVSCCSCYAVALVSIFFIFVVFLLSSLFMFMLLLLLLLSSSNLLRKNRLSNTTSLWFFIAKEKQNSSAMAMRIKRRKTNWPQTGIGPMPFGLALRRCKPPSYWDPTPQPPHSTSFNISSHCQQRFRSQTLWLCDPNLRLVNFSLIDPHCYARCPCASSSFLLFPALSLL